MRSDVIRVAFKEAGCAEASRPLQDSHSEMGVLTLELRGKYGRTISIVMW